MKRWLTARHWPLQLRIVLLLFVSSVVPLLVLGGVEYRHARDQALAGAEAISTGGRESVAGSVDAMRHIQEQMDSIAGRIVRLPEQNQAIGEIIATVNDLTEQSNLLAVNAAIEAAKAGDQGKGFAVVVQEIKSLAEQSKRATAQVRTILGDIQKAAQNVVSTQQTEAAAQNLHELGQRLRGLVERYGV